MLLKIWSLLAGTSIALQSISVLFSSLLLPFPRRCLQVPADPPGSGPGTGPMVGINKAGALLQGEGNGREIGRGVRARRHKPLGAGERSILGLETPDPRARMMGIRPRAPRLEKLRAPTPRVVLVPQVQQPKPQSGAAALARAFISQGLVSDPRAPALPALRRRGCSVTPQHFQARYLECLVGPWHPSAGHPAASAPTGR